MTPKPGASGCYSEALIFLLILVPLIALVLGLVAATVNQVRPLVEQLMRSL